MFCLLCSFVWTHKVSEWREVVAEHNKNRKWKGLIRFMLGLPSLDPIADNLVGLHFSSSPIHFLSLSLFLFIWLLSKTYFLFLWSSSFSSHSPFCVSLLFFISFYFIPVPVLCEKRTAQLRVTYFNNPASYLLLNPAITWAPSVRKPARLGREYITNQFSRRKPEEKKAIRCLWNKKTQATKTKQILAISSWKENIERTFWRKHSGRVNDRETICSPCASQLFEEEMRDTHSTVGITYCWRTLTSSTRQNWRIQPHRGRPVF